MIKLDTDVEAMVRRSTGGMYRIHGETYRSYNHTLAQSSTQSSINVPIKCPSLKTLHVVHRYTANVTGVDKGSITNRT